MTDIDGEIFQHLEYFPFGETWVEESSNTQRTPYLFTGKELDEQTGLYYFGARYYDPRTSVWQNPDPILASYMEGTPNDGVQNPRNLSLYSYTWQNPVKLVDPTGEAVWLCAVPTGPMQACAAGAAAVGEGLLYVGSASLAAFGVHSAMNFEPASGGMASLPQSEAALNTPSRQMSITSGNYTAQEIAVFRSSFRNMRDRAVAAGVISAAVANNQKIILIPEGVIPEIAAVDAQGIAVHGNVLTWDPANAATNRQAAIGGLGPAGLGRSWEEYPFASTTQGGASATTGNVRLWEQWVQGGLIRGACAVQACKPNDTLHVYIVPQAVYQGE